MFKKTVLALTAAVTLASTAVAVSAPAEAHIYPVFEHHNGYFHHYGYWGHPHIFVNGYVGPVADCYWVSRPVKIWTLGGPIWEHRTLQVCN